MYFAPFKVDTLIDVALESERERCESLINFAHYSYAKHIQHIICPLYKITQSSIKQAK